MSNSSHEKDPLIAVDGRRTPLRETNGSCCDADRDNLFPEIMVPPHSCAERWILNQRYGRQSIRELLRVFGYSVRVTWQNFWSRGDRVSVPLFLETCKIPNILEADHQYAYESKTIINLNWNVPACGSILLLCDSLRRGTAAEMAPRSTRSGVERGSDGGPPSATIVSELPPTCKGHVR